MDTSPTPEMMEQHRLNPTENAAAKYGRQHPHEFGGMYWESGPVGRYVAFFTGRVGEHLQALRDLVPHPDRIETRQCRYSEQQAEAWAMQVRQRLRGHENRHSVTGYGMALRVNSGLGHVPQVWTWPWSECGAEEIRRELEPIPVEVIPMPPDALVPLSADPPGRRGGVSGLEASS
jgi:hypothetical protein